MNEVIDYIMNTPGNTNPNVLRGMLQNNEGNSGGVFIVNVVHDETLNKNKLDKNYSEIIAEVNAGKVVFGKMEGSGVICMFPAGLFSEQANMCGIGFIMIGEDRPIIFMSDSNTGVLFESNEGSGNEGSGNEGSGNEGSGNEGPVSEA